MNYLKFDYLKKIETTLFENLAFVLDAFASEVDSKMIVKAAELSWIELSMTNSQKNRMIQVIISEGVNADYKQAYSIRFNIKKLISGRDEVVSFSIRDYCNEMNLGFDLKEFFTEPCNFLIELKEYLDCVKQVVETAEMRSILFDDQWVEIKPNLAPYK